MQSIAARLTGLLRKVERPGDFYAAGTAAIFLPQLEVDGVGVIALPLLDAQAEQLIAAAERAPYGRGAETVHDEKVRRTWQIDASRVRIAGRRWQESLNALVAEAAAGLGVAEPVAAEFHKLLVYGEGDFFVSHRDTEKCPGMFATLVIVLPSIYTGGELVVRHRGREVTLDMRCEDPSEAAFAAFYADCVHEVLPITSGCRLTLIYNLRRAGAAPYRRRPITAANKMSWRNCCTGGPARHPGRPHRKTDLSAAACLHAGRIILRSAERRRCRRSCGAQRRRGPFGVRIASCAYLHRGKRLAEQRPLWFALGAEFR